jgi:hypothetical protein
METLGKGKSQRALPKPPEALSQTRLKTNSMSRKYGTNCTVESGASASRVKLVQRTLLCPLLTALSRLTRTGQKSTVFALA